jgi:hypothetical protein
MNPVVTRPAETGFTTPLSMTLGWAIYLATSWTWVIGMFFPVLLIRDFGIYGWIVFAAPNVLGAAAVGFVTFRDAPSAADDSWKRRHATMLSIFALVTVSFHLFGISCLLSYLLSPVTASVAAVAGASAAMFIRRLHDSAVIRRIGLAAFGISAAAAVVFLAYGGHLVGPRPALAIDADQVFGLICLAPGIASGFLLCPHLDLTLQRVRDELPPSQARLAFGVGFGVFFTGMICFTVAYSGYLIDVLNRGGVALGILGIALGLHIVTQALFTTSIHAEPFLRRTAGELRANRARRAGVAAIVVLPAAVFPGLITWMTPLGMTVGEVVYRCFIGFYGVLFPVYTWAAMICRGWERPGPSRFTWKMIGAVVSISLPLFAVSFLLRFYFWAVPAVGIMLGVPWFLRNAGRPTSSGMSAA